MSLLIERVPARDLKGKLVGYAEYSNYEKFVELVGGVQIPREYQLRLEGLEGDPVVVIRYRVEKGIPTVASVNIEGGHINPNVLDNVRRQLLSWNEWAQRAVMSTTTDEGYRAPGVSKDDRRAAETEVKRRRGEIKMARLREVAALYNATVDSGTAYATIADRFGKSEPTAARWVAEARAAGLDVKVPPRGRLKGTEK
jgi:hypothetical protein